MREQALNLTISRGTDFNQRIAVTVDGYLYDLHEFDKVLLLVKLGNGNTKKFMREDWLDYSNQGIINILLYRYELEDLFNSSTSKLPFTIDLTNYTDTELKDVELESEKNKVGNYRRLFRGIITII